MKKGRLEHFSGTQILSLVTLAKKSGGLDVNHDEQKAQLAFKDGKLIFAAQGIADGSLSSVLARDGRISERQAETLAKHAERTGDKQLGLLLIQKGYVSRADIVQSIKRHCLAVVKQFAAWQEGDWLFDPGEAIGKERITVPLDLENVIIEIVRAHKHDEQLELEMPSLDVGLRHNKRPDVNIRDLQLSKGEWSVLKYIKPENSIRMIANSLQMNDNQIRRVVGSLRAAGLVELVAERHHVELTPEEKEKKRDNVWRIIKRVKDI